MVPMTPEEPMTAASPDDGSGSQDGLLREAAAHVVSVFRTIPAPLAAVHVSAIDMLDGFVQRATTQGQPPVTGVDDRTLRLERALKRTYALLPPDRLGAVDVETEAILNALPSIEAARLTSTTQGQPPVTGVDVRWLEDAAQEALRTAEATGNEPLTWDNGVGVGIATMQRVIAARLTSTVVPDDKDG